MQQTSYNNMENIIFLNIPVSQLYEYCEQNMYNLEKG